MRVKLGDIERRLRELTRQREHALSEGEPASSVDEDYKRLVEEKNRISGKIAALTSPKQPGSIVLSGATGGDEAAGEERGSGGSTDQKTGRHGGRSKPGMSPEDAWRLIISSGKLSMDLEKKEGFLLTPAIYRTEFRKYQHSLAISAGVPTGYVFPPFADSTIYRDLSGLLDVDYKGRKGYGYLTVHKRGGKNYYKLTRKGRRKLRLIERICHEVCYGKMDERTRIVRNPSVEIIGRVKLINYGFRAKEQFDRIEELLNDRTVQLDISVVAFAICAKAHYLAFKDDSRLTYFKKLLDETEGFIRVLSKRWGKDMRDTITLAISDAHDNQPRGEYAPRFYAKALFHILLMKYEDERARCRNVLTNVKRTAKKALSHKTDNANKHLNGLIALVDYGLSIYEKSKEKKTGSPSDEDPSEADRNLLEGLLTDDGLRQRFAELFDPEERGPFDPGLNILKRQAPGAEGLNTEGEGRAAAEPTRPQVDIQQLVSKGAVGGIIASGVSPQIVRDLIRTFNPMLTPLYEKALKKAQGIPDSPEDRATSLANEGLWSITGFRSALERLRGAIGEYAALLKGRNKKLPGEDRLSRKLDSLDQELGELEGLFKNPADIKGEPDIPSEKPSKRKDALKKRHKISFTHENLRVNFDIDEISNEIYKFSSGDIIDGLKACIDSCSGKMEAMSMKNFTVKTHECIITLKPKREITEFTVMAKSPTPGRYIDIVTGTITAEPETSSLIEEYSKWILQLAGNDGPGTEDLAWAKAQEVKFTSDEWQGMFEAVNLLHKTDIEVILSQEGTKLTGNTRRIIRQMKTRCSGNGSYFNVEEFSTISDRRSLETVLRSGKREGLKRIIVVTDEGSRKAVSALLKKDPQLFNCVRVINISLPVNYSRMRANQKTLYQADLLNKALFARLYYNNSSQYLKGIVRQMFKDCVDSVDDFLKELGRPDNENETEDEIKTRINRLLGKVVSLLEKLEEELRMTRVFLTFA
ncbi:MAG: hypothetical protein JW994_04825 [Candidatus Omnitrophica bacterium]|nr:hypothetical protein [Candidatus Omnitrophota bacterium]